MGFEVSEKVGLVTGANRGIGLAIVESLLKAGATKVYAAVRRVDSAQPLIDQHGSRVVAIEADLSRPETIFAAAQAAGDVQLVINNAGVLEAATPLDATAFDALRYEMDVNVCGLMRVAQAFAPVLKRNGGGALVQLNSVASLQAFPAFATYCASKAAAYSLTQSLRVLLAAQGTQVLSVHPGPIATDMAHTAGLAEIAEPASQVGEGIIAALRAGEFHLWPDTLAKQLGAAYDSFARSVVEAEQLE